MADFRVEVGATDGYRYVGIQPPLDEEQAALLKGIEVPRFMFPVGNGRVEPARGDAYSEVGFDTSAVNGSAEIVKVANGIAEALRSGGHHVGVDETVRAIGFGRFLFGGEAERLG